MAAMSAWSASGTHQHVNRVADDVDAEEDDHRHQKHDQKRLKKSADHEDGHGDQFPGQRGKPGRWSGGPAEIRAYSFTTPMASVYSSVRAM